MRDKTPVVSDPEPRKIWTASEMGKKGGGARPGYQLAAVMRNIELARKAAHKSEAKREAARRNIAKGREALAKKRAAAKE